jgi:pyrroline-5-carboxylate reductase
MKTKSLGFIGGGRITKIFLQVIKNNRSEYKAIVVYDTDQAVLSQLKEQFSGIILAKNAGEAAMQDLVFIALHPPVILDTLQMVKGQIKPGTMVISLAPKISIAKIASILPQAPNIARLIPNATSIVNEGYNPICFAGAFSDMKKQSLLRILRRMGRTFEVPEDKLESYAIISAMLPTYFWFQWKKIIEIGSQIGLTPEESQNTVRDTLLAAIRTYFYAGMQPGEIMDLIPVKPIGVHEEQISKFFEDKLLTLFANIKAETKQ